MADMQGLNPDFANRLTQLFQAVSQQGGSLYIESGYRTNAQQAALYAKEPGLAAPPGHSNHERGLAADIHGSLDLAHRLAPLYGLQFPVPGEAWHVEPVYARNGQPIPDANGNTTDQATPAAATGPVTPPDDRLAAALMNALSNGPTSDAFNPSTDQPPVTAQAQTTSTGPTGGGEKFNASGGINNFATALLNKLGLPVTDENIKFMAAWQRAEGGSADNPFNTTQGAPGAVNFNSVGVKRYPSVDVGLNATAQTLSNGRYGNILAALAAGNSAMAAAQALANSPWGTGSLVERILGGK